MSVTSWPRLLRFRDRNFVWIAGPDMKDTVGKSVRIPTCILPSSRPIGASGELGFNCHTATEVQQGTLARSVC